jgi:hypothetical protein
MNVVQIFTVAVSALSIAISAYTIVTARRRRR